MTETEKAIAEEWKKLVPIMKNEHKAYTLGMLNTIDAFNAMTRQAAADESER